MLAMMTLAAQLGSQATPAPLILDRVMITAMSVRPPPSGIFATYVAVQGTIDSAEPVTVYIPYFGQPLPSVSSLCRFEISEREIPRAGPQRAKRHVVERFRCELTSESPPIPDLPRPEPLYD
jgi:hypothetical protein